MDFNLTEQQEMIRTMSRKFFEDKCPSSLVTEMEADERGYPPELWREIAELGWIGLPFPSKYGGSDGNFLDLAVLLEEMGRTMLPGPYFSTMILGGLLLLDAGSEEQQSRILPGLMKGGTLITLAVNERQTQLSPQYMKTVADSYPGGYFIRGSKFMVPDALTAHIIICAALTEPGNLTLFLVDRADAGERLEVKRLTTIGQDKMCEVVFDNVPVKAEQVVGGVGKGAEIVERLMEKAMVARALHMVGGAQKVLDMATEHAKTRVQFGKRIGSFQAIQHHCSDMLVDLNGARYLAYRTAWMISERLPCQQQCYMTKSWCNDMYRRVSRLGVQIYGGMGVMKEYGMQLYLRQAAFANVFLGDSDACREKVAVGLGL